jgi:chromosome segregation ATPase
LVQSVLFFALGFLCAVFLVSLIAPAVWRRAVVLTRRRLEASLPLTPAEIQADKDRVRAEYAMMTRKLEMTIKSLQEKTAEQLVEIGRGREALKGLAVEKKDKNQALSDLQAKTAELRQREEDQQRLSDRLAQTERALEKRALELQKLEQMYDDASFSSSNRQIELVARESELEKLANDIAVLRGQRKEADRRNQDIVSESKAANEALKVEKKKVADLDKKVERLLATLADREEKLDRREKELARARERSKEAAAANGVARLAGGADAKGEEFDKAIAKLEGDRERLEARLTVLARENKRLKTDLTTSETGKPEQAPDARLAGAGLREQMNELAAEVVNLTMKLDGPDSPIAKALAADGQQGSGGRGVSLADRVRALQKAEPAN